MPTLTQTTVTKTTVRIPREVWEELRREAYEQKRSIESVLEQITRQHYGLSDPQAADTKTA